MPKSKVDKLADEIREHQKLYDGGKAEISDADFDHLVERLRSIDAEHPALAELGSTMTPRRKSHAFPMLSLEKVKDAKAAEAWARRTGADKFLIAPKYDGLALSLYYKDGALISAVTRGDGQSGDDVTHNAKHIRSIPKRLRKLNLPASLIVRGEALFPRTASVLANFANARNAAAGTLLRKTPDINALLEIDFIVYDVLFPPSFSVAEASSLAWALSRAEDWGLHTGSTTLTTKIDNLNGYAARWGIPDDFEYECDGLVVKVDRYELREKLGATSHHPRWAVALKFAAERAKTALTSIEWQVSRTGTLTPVAIVEPVRLSGAVVRRATLHNLDQLDRLNLRVPSTVEMSRRGGVIPHVEKMLSSDGYPVTLPSNCPSCGEPAHRHGGTLVCSEPQNCPGALRAVISHWCTTTDMLGWGEEVIHALWEHGVKTRAALYECDDVLVEMFGEKVGKKLARERDKKATMGPATFIAALGLKGVGKAQALKLLEQFDSVERLLQLCDTDHDTLREALTPVLFNNLVNDVLVQRREIEELFGGYVKLAATASKDGPLSGMAIVFTGKLTDMEREEARALVRDLGGEAPDTVTTKITHLVVGDLARDEQVSKRDKVAKYNAKGAKIVVISEEEFTAMITR